MNREFRNSPAKEKLVVNGRFLCEARPTGTQRSAFFLLRALADLQPGIRVLCPDVIRIPMHITPNLRRAIETIPAPCGMHNQLWEQLIFPRCYSRASHINLMGTSSFLFGSDRNIVLVHDLNYELIPQSFDWRFRLWYRLACGMAARHAARIVTNSEYSRSIIGRYLGPKVAKKCSVIRFGTGVDAKLLSAGVTRLKRDYILCVGSLQPHKNLLTVLQAFKKLRESGLDLFLKIVGRRQGFFNALSIPDELLNQPGSEFTGYVDDAQLAELYQQAKAFIYPSFEEGFGLPVVEAFTAGCPVVTSNRSCLPEVAGDAALFADPRDADSVADAIRRIMNVEGLADQLMSAGLERANHFQWSKGAEDLLRACPNGEAG